MLFTDFKFQNNFRDIAGQSRRLQQGHCGGGGQNDTVVKLTRCVTLAEQQNVKICFFLQILF